MSKNQGEKQIKSDMATTGHIRSTTCTSLTLLFLILPRRKTADAEAEAFNEPFLQNCRQNSLLTQLQLMPEISIAKAEALKQPRAHRSRRFRSE